MARDAQKLAAGHPVSQPHAKGSIGRTNSPVGEYDASAGETGLSGGGNDRGGPKTKFNHGAAGIKTAPGYSS